MKTSFELLSFSEEWADSSTVWVEHWKLLQLQSTSQHRPPMGLPASDEGSLPAPPLPPPSAAVPLELRPTSPASAGAVAPLARDSPLAPTPTGHAPPAPWTPGLPVPAASGSAWIAARPASAEGGAALRYSPAASA